MQPLVDESFRGRLEAELPNPDEIKGKLILLTLETHTMSHFDVLGAVLPRYDAERCRVVRVISGIPEFFTKSLNLSPVQLSRRNTALLERLTGHRRIRVRTSAGTDLEVELDSSVYDWICNCGLWRPGAFVLLPAGEIATFPARLNGVLVADGAINCNVVLPGLDMRLAENPLTIEILDGKAVTFQCQNSKLSDLVRRCLELENGRNVGELGFGTNAGIDEFIPANSHINERRPGVHLGFGQHNQSPAQVPYRAAVHMDVITDGATIEIEGESSPIDLACAPTSSKEHPNVRSDDITGDCCGFGLSRLGARPATDL